MSRVRASGIINRFKDIYPGWWTVLASGIMTGWGWGAWGYGFGAYFKPLIEEFGWTRAQLSAAYSRARHYISVNSDRHIKEKNG